MDIEEVLGRGVVEILPSKEGLSALMKKRQITLYQGFDPSSAHLHIGHLAGFRKLAQFQALGHKVIFLIGDFTGMIGDPTDKSATRQKLTQSQVRQNLKNYQKHASSVLSFSGKNKAEVKLNAQWLSKLSFTDVIELASNFTVQQMLERDFFQQRLKGNKPIFLHEFLYPLMQGYDSIAMDVDLEIGATDQLFNMLAGRSLLKSLKNKEKYILTLKLLEDEGGKKMGKSEGNAINLDQSAEEIFGGIMSLPDGFIERGIELLTDLPVDFAKKKKPLTAKKRLAWEVVRQVHTEAEADKAQEHFEKTFQKGRPDYTQEIKTKGSLVATLAPIVGSKSETKRLIEQKAVSINGKKVKDANYKFKGGERVKIGKKTFVRIKK